MNITINKEGINLANVLGITKERFEEIVTSIGVLNEVNGLDEKIATRDDFQQIFDLLQSVAQTPGEEAFLIVIFGDIITQVITREKLNKFENDFIASQLPQN